MENEPASKAFAEAIAATGSGVVGSRHSTRHMRDRVSGNGGSNGGQSAVKNHPNGSQPITSLSQDPK